MIPIAALRGSCALPIQKVGYNADIREGRLQSFPPHRWSARPLPREQPNASIEQDERRRLAARQHIVADRHRDNGPSPRKAARQCPRTARKARKSRDLPPARGRGLVERRPRGVIASSGAPPPFEDMVDGPGEDVGPHHHPAPPPAGVSSTERWRSVAKSRICTVSSDQIPSPAPGRRGCGRAAPALPGRG